MPFTKEQTREAYKKLSPEAQDFVVALDTTDLISSEIEKAGIMGDAADSADSEIIYAMFSLQTLDKAIENIAASTQKPIESLNPLKESLNKEIFSKLSELNSEAALVPEGPVIITPETKDEALKQLSQVSIKKDEAAPETAPKSENLPMVEAGEAAHDVPHVETSPIAEKVAQAKAPEPQTPITPAPRAPEKPKLSTPDYRYPGGKDPYREPIE